MRKLTQIIKLADETEGYMEIPGNNVEILALDENGELWFGALESTEDKRRVIDWSPVNRPKDGASFTEPQLSFFDQWEREARAIIEADRQRNAVSLETPGAADTGTTGGTVQATPDDSVEDGEGTDPDLGSREGSD